MHALQRFIFLSKRVFVQNSMLTYNYAWWIRYEMKSLYISFNNITFEIWKLEDSVYNVITGKITS